METFVNWFFANLYIVLGLIGIALLGAVLTITKYFLGEAAACKKYGAQKLADRMYISRQTYTSTRRLLIAGGFMATSGNRTPEQLYEPLRFKLFGFMPEEVTRPEPNGIVVIVYEQQATKGSIFNAAKTKVLASVLTA